MVAMFTNVYPLRGVIGNNCSRKIPKSILHYLTGILVTLK